LTCRCCRDNGKVTLTFCRSGLLVTSYVTLRPIHHSLPPMLRYFAIIALLVGSFCNGQPIARVGKPPSSPERTYAKMNAARSQSLRPPGGRTDPRYRQPQNLAELQAVAGEVAKSTGRKIHWNLTLGENPGPLVRIAGDLENCTISIHPVAARKVPPNTWAFLFGHEFAHLTENLGPPSQTTPAKELKADIAGARYAMAAGYRLESFLGWVLTEPNQSSNSHGPLRLRVQSIATHFGIPQTTIQEQARRYSTPQVRGVF